MIRPEFVVQPLEPRRTLSAHAVAEFAAALGASQAIESIPLQAEPGLRTDHQALDRALNDLRSALANMARRMGT